jgi:hypothetical protein
MTRTIVSITLIGMATAAGYLAIKGWRDAILGAGIALVLWIVASRVFRRLGRFRPPRVSLFDRALHVPAMRPGRPADLEAVERVFGWRSYAPDEFEHRIKPFIRRLVERRLLDHRGIDLSADPERATAHLGPHLRGSLFEARETRAETRDIATLVDEVVAI